MTQGLPLAMYPRSLSTTPSSSPLSELTSNPSVCGWAIIQFKLSKNKLPRSCGSVTRATRPPSHRAYAILCRKNNTAAELFDIFLHELVLRQQNGIPLELISDRDKIFTSKFFKECTNRLGISLRLSSARSQQTNEKQNEKSQYWKKY